MEGIKHENMKTHKYDSILHQPYRPSNRHRSMKQSDRAAQFAPFAALSGHEEILAESARITENKIELSEDALHRLNDKLAFLASIQNQHPFIQVTYFLPDETKLGGSYETIQGRLKTIDEIHFFIIMDNKKSIAMKDILTIECDAFPSEIET